MTVVTTRGVISALLTLVVAALALWEGYQHPVGTLRRIGPGFFPVALGVVLIVLALLLLFERDGGRDAELPEPPSARAIAAILAGMIMFAVLLERAGLVPAVAALVFVSAYAESRNLVSVLALTAALTALALVVFIYLLGLPMRPLGGW